MATATAPAPPTATMLSEPGRSALNASRSAFWALLLRDLAVLKKNLGGPDLPFSIQIIVGPQGPFVDFDFLFEDEPEEPDPQIAEVCFYQQANFKGANFCVEEGDEDASIPGSCNNNIESILISGGLGVEVCAGAGHGGECFYYTSSKKSLPSEIRNRISSYMVDGGDGSDDFGDDDGDDNIIILN